MNGHISGVGSLDAEVAERVMGWTLRPVHGIGWWARGDDGRWKVAANAGGFRPSTNIAAAWEVLEHLNRVGWLVQVDNLGGELADQWRVVVWWDGADHRHPADARTAPLAICRAALAAVEADAPHPTTEGAP